MPTAPLPTGLTDELDLLAALVPLARARVVELGCGPADLARQLLARYPGAVVTALEVDERQMAKNLAAPATPGLRFVAAGAQAIPAADGVFDLALMLKSLHHVPLPLMATALGEVRRVLRPGGWLYVSEPVFDGAFNDIVRLFNDEQVVRAAAQRALDAALADGGWQQRADHRFQMPVQFPDFDSFERRLMRPTFADLQIDGALRERVRAAFTPHCGPEGARFQRLMHLRLLQRTG